MRNRQPRSQSYSRSSEDEESESSADETFMDLAETSMGTFNEVSFAPSRSIKVSRASMDVQGRGVHSWRFPLLHIEVHRGLRTAPSRSIEVWPAPSRSIEESRAPLRSNMP